MPLSGDLKLRLRKTDSLPSAQLFSSTKYPQRPNTARVRTLLPFEEESSRPFSANSCKTTRTDSYSGGRPMTPSSPPSLSAHTRGATFSPPAEVITEVLKHELKGPALSGFLRAMHGPADNHNNIHDLVGLKNTRLVSTNHKDLMQVLDKYPVKRSASSPIQRSKSPTMQFFGRAADTSSALDMYSEKSPARLDPQLLVAMPPEAHYEHILCTNCRLQVDRTCSTCRYNRTLIEVLRNAPCQTIEIQPGGTSSGTHPSLLVSKQPKPAPLPPTAHRDVTQPVQHDSYRDVLNRYTHGPLYPVTRGHQKCTTDAETKKLPFFPKSVFDSLKLQSSPPDGENLERKFKSAHQKRKTLLSVMTGSMNPLNSVTMNGNSPKSPMRAQQLSSTAVALTVADKRPHYRQVLSHDRPIMKPSPSAKQQFEVGGSKLHIDAPTFSVPPQATEHVGGNDARIASDPSLSCLYRLATSPPGALGTVSGASSPVASDSCRPKLAIMENHLRKAALHERAKSSSPKAMARSSTVPKIPASVHSNSAAALPKVLFAGTPVVAEGNSQMSSSAENIKRSVRLTIAPSNNIPVASTTQSPSKLSKLPTQKRVATWDADSSDSLPNTRPTCDSSSDVHKEKAPYLPLSVERSFEKFS
eukprot:GILJ01004578.1.p1 GENE.GILJ01004578.1~~GILJ01004578.1.p1  ORF type:complete len:641 (+),score=68.79 GILJ01004578.1:31-1953(+)